MTDESNIAERRARALYRLAERDDVSETEREALKASAERFLRDAAKARAAE